MQKNRPVNDFARYLKGEFEYWHAIITNESQRTHWQQKQFNRRKQLAEAKIRDKSTVVIEELVNEDTITFQEIATTTNCDTEMKMKNPVPSILKDSYDEGECCFISFKRLENLQVIQTNGIKCSYCAINNGDRNCKKRLCIECCGAMEFACAVKPHNVRKVNTLICYQNYVTEIQQKINKGVQELTWITYSNGGDPKKKRTRPLYLSKWVEYPISFKAHCDCKYKNCSPDVEKTYHIIHISEILEGPPSNY